MSVVAKPISDPDAPLLWAFTVEQYHNMIDSGVLEEGAPFELLNGMVVRKERHFPGEDSMTAHPEHAIAVKRLAALGSSLGPGCHIQTQQPITIPPCSEPEPDAAIVFGSEESFAHRHPRADDIACVIEVSAASLRRDRTGKLELYASAGISRYLILNLLDRVIEVYTEPMKSRYEKKVVLTPKQKVELPTAKKPLVIPVKRLLP